MKRILSSAFLLVIFARPLLAGTPLTDTNLQLFYDFGKDRQFVTSTFEMFHPDSWGNTFFFIDIDYNFKDNSNKNISPGGAYLEIARCIHLGGEPTLKDLSLQLEYNGGLGALFGGYPINHAFLAGVNYCIHDTDYRNTLNLSVLYKKFVKMDQQLQMQFTAVWGMQNLFGAKGLRFSGFADVWWEGKKTVFLSEPQLWYSVGQFFNCSNLNLGGELEVSSNFAGYSGWAIRPCLGLKWIF